MEPQDAQSIPTHLVLTNLPNTCCLESELLSISQCLLSLLGTSTSPTVWAFLVGSLQVCHLGTLPATQKVP